MILHIDLDSFFVSASIIDRPELKNSPVCVVGANKKDEFGDAQSGNVVLSASYKAREFGVCSAMPLFKAKALCKNLIILEANHAFYRKLSKHIFNIIYSYTPSIEQFSIDEFFVDLTGIKWENSPLEFAKILQSRILNEIGLPASIGISQNKYMAKFSTDMAKPFGIMLTQNSEIRAKFGLINVAKFPGIGKKMVAKLNKNGIYTINDAIDSKFIFENFGKSGVKIYNSLIGTPTKELNLSKKRKSLGFSRTFNGVLDRDEIKRRFLVICRYLSFDVYKTSLHPQTFEIKFRYENRVVKTKSKTLHEPFCSQNLTKIVAELFKEVDDKKELGINFISVTCQNFLSEENIPKSLFYSPNSKAMMADRAFADIFKKHGINSLKRADEIVDD